MARPGGREQRRSLTLHWQGSPVTFNPFSSLSLASWFPFWFLFDQLVHIDAAGRPVPQLATDWRAADHATKYTFRLRTGVRWHDGAPFTAEDVRFTYTILVDPHSGSRFGSVIMPIRGTAEYAHGRATAIAGIDVLDDHTIAFELAAPHAGFPAIMGFPILPRHLLEPLARHGNLDRSEFALRSPIGTGPFRLDDYIPGERAVLAPNREYFGGSPQAGQLDLLQVPDDRALEEFERGAVDVMFVDALDAARVQERPGARILPVRTCEYRTFICNLDHPTLSDRRVREAILLSIDREAIVRDVLSGMGEIVNSVITMPDWAVNRRLNGRYRYDPSKARQLLTEAGHAHGVHLNLLTGPGAIPARQDAPFLSAVQQYLEAVGIELTITIKDVADYTADYLAGRFDLFTCCGASGPDPDFTSLYFHSGSWPPNGSNGARYANPVVDELLARGRAETDQDRRAQFYQRYAEVVSDDLPWLVTWHENRVLALNRGVRGEYANLAMAWVPGTLPESIGWTKDDEGLTPSSLTPPASGSRRRQPPEEATVQHNTEQADLLLKGGRVITMDADRRILSDGSIAIRDGAIVGVGPDRDITPRFAAQAVRDLRGAVVHPGLIDGHAHPGTLELGRGFFPKHDPDVGPLESMLWNMRSPETEYLGTLLACMEMATNGITLYGDTGTSFFLEETARAIDTVGIRGLPGHLLLDTNVDVRETRSMSREEADLLFTPTDECLARLTGQLERYPFHGRGRVRCPVTLYGAGRNTDQLLTQARALADKYRVPMILHQSWGREEVTASRRLYGKDPVQHLSDLGVLDPMVTLVHMTHLTKQEVDVVAEAGSAVVHCPAAAARRGVGAIREGMFPEMVARGVPVSLGSDGISGKHDVLRQAYLAAVGFREVRGDFPVLTAEDTFTMATVNGARALGLADEVGSLEVGKRADIVIHAVDRPEAYPRFRDPVDGLVFYGQAATVDTVLVDGEVVLDGGRFTRFDSAEVYRQLDEMAERIEDALGAAAFTPWLIVE